MTIGRTFSVEEKNMTTVELRFYDTVRIRLGDSKIVSPDLTFWRQAAANDIVVSGYGL